MITARGIITLLVLAVLFAPAAARTSRPAGRKREARGGHRSSCFQHWETTEKKH